MSHWPGILVGDMSQPRGGPMLTGHASHQIGLDVDIWLKPMPPFTLSHEQREEMMSTNVVRADRLDVDPRYWTPSHLEVIKAAAEDSEVQRIFVNAAIKKALCREAGPDREWLHKVRPVLRPRLPFPCAAYLPAGGIVLRRARPCAAGRWLRPCLARLLVLGGRAASASATWPDAPAPGANARRSARRLPHGSDTEVAGRPCCDR